MCSNRIAQAKRLRTLSIDSRALPNPLEPRPGFRTFYSSLPLSPSLQNLRQANPLLLLLQDNPRYIIPPNSPTISTAGKKKKKTLKSVSSNCPILVIIVAMAAMIASRRAASMARLLEKLLVNPARGLEASSQSVVRSFNTNAQMRGIDEDERALDVDRRGDDRVSRRQRRDDVDYPLFAGVFDPFNPSRSLSQVLNLMDQMMDAPFPASARGMAGGARRGWDAKEDNDALYLRIDMPGLGKEHVKVSAEQNTLIIRGEGEKESEDDEAGRRYSSRIDLPEGLYKMDQIRAEMKNGVLKVTVPKAKEEERKDVFQVQIE